MHEHRFYGVSLYYDCICLHRSKPCRMILKWSFLQYLIPLLLLIFHQYLQKAGCSSIILRSYLDDILVVPTCMGVWLFTLELFLTKINRTSRIIAALSGVLFFSTLFEFILPLYLINSTRDYWDILAYFIGALSYLALLEFTPRPKSA